MNNEFSELKNPFLRIGLHRLVVVIIQILLVINLQGQSLITWSEISPGDDLPSEIELFKGVGSINGDTLTAYYTRTNLETGRFVFYPLYSEMNQKPGAYYDENRDDVVIITNGGYFGTNVSYSMVRNDYVTHAPNIRAVNRTFNNQSHAYYPTRAAFGISPSRFARAEYVYTVQEGVTYRYPEPSQNSTDALPLPQPGPDFPDGGNPWDVSEAIGGGPLLIKNGEPIADYTPELFPPDITSSTAPRTAIGITADDKLINLVVDGRQEHSKGVSLGELTDILLELDCVEAINLDGGGSSCLLVRDQVINQPSDGTTRNIPSVVTIKSASLFHIHDLEFFNPVTQPTDSLEYNFYGFHRWYIFPPGKTGTFHIRPRNPAAYRIELPVRGNSSPVYSDSLQFVLHRKGKPGDTLYLDQGNTESDYFYTPGSYQLGPQDSLTVFNLDSEHDALLAGFRLIRTKSGNPAVSILNRDSFGKHSFNETIMIVAEATSRNSYRKIERFQLYEEKEGIVTLKTDHSFEPAGQSRDTVWYTVESLHDPVLLHLTYSDTYGDSVSVTYTIQQDLSPPTVSFGKNSVLTGTPGDTLLFELKVKPGHPSRSLRSLRVYRNPDTGNKELASYTPNPSGDTILFTYPISPDDIPGIHFRFITTDTADFSGVRDYTLEVTGKEETTTGPLHLLYLSDAHSLRFQRGTTASRYMVHLQVVDLYGRVLYAARRPSGETINLPCMESGIYIVRYQYGRQMESELFFVGAPGISPIP